MGQNKVVVYLISKGANIEAIDNKYGATPLYWAAAAGKKDVVETLLSKGALVNIKDNKGKTLVSVAAQSKNQDIVNLLKSHGGKE
jgi:ankyrin repeat protein